MRAPPALRWWRRQSGNPPNSLCVRRTRTPLKLRPRLAYVPRPELFMRGEFEADAPVKHWSLRLVSDFQPVHAPTLSPAR